jgi:transcriptional regulator with XRE-family HTH domain
MVHILGLRNLAPRLEQEQILSMIVDGAQIKAARALLGWHQTELAAAAGVHFNSLLSLEKLGRISDATRELRSGTIERVEKALREAGISIYAHPVGVYRN